MTTPLALNLRHLDAVAAVVRAGSITKAAALVNLSQPTLTQAIGQLERQLGHVLFDRQPGGVSPTPAGSLFAARIDRAVERIAESCRAVQRMAKTRHLPYPERHLSMTQIRAFLSVAEQGSFARAARSLGLAQPSIHRAAKELELSLGLPLFLRTGQLIKLSAAGERLARDLRLALGELRAGLDELADMQRAGSGRVVVGSLPLPRARLLPAALAQFSADFPWAEIQVIEGSYAELVAALRDGSIDIMIGALRHDPAAGLSEEGLLDAELYVVGSSHHPLAGTVATPKQLATYPWVVAAPGAPMRDKWEALFDGVQKPDRTIQCGSILVARGLLLAGGWLALMSRDQFMEERASGSINSIGPAVPGSSRTIGLTTRPDWRPTAAQSGLIAAIRRAAGVRN